MLSLYPQNGGSIVTIDSVTSLHPCIVKRKARIWVRYFGNLSNIDDRIRNISWQTLNLTQTVTLTLTIYIHTRPSMFDGLQK